MKISGHLVLPVIIFLAYTSASAQSTICRFDVGPRAGQIQDFAPLELPQGNVCTDGVSTGQIIPAIKVVGANTSSSKSADWAANESVNNYQEVQHFRYDPSAPLVEQVEAVSREEELLSNIDKKSITGRSLTRTIENEKEAIKSRLLALPQFNFDAKTYQVSAKISIERRDIQSLIYAKDIKTHLAESSGLIDILSDAERLKLLSMWYGDELVDSLRAKGKDIASAQSLETRLETASDTLRKQELNDLSPVVLLGKLSFGMSKDVAIRAIGRDQEIVSETAAELNHQFWVCGQSYFNRRPFWVE